MGQDWPIVCILLTGIGYGFYLGLVVMGAFRSKGGS